MSPETGKFQPRVITSFRPYQLEEVRTWYGPEVINFAQAGNFESAFQALEQAQIDERGKPINDRGRTRLRYGLDAIIVTSRQTDVGYKIGGDILVWQEGEKEEEVSIKFRLADPETSSMSFSYTPPSIESKSASPKTNNIIRNPIELSQLRAQMERTIEQAEQLKKIVVDQFGAGMMDIFGKFLMDSDKKRTTNPDGGVLEEDWGMSDIFERWAQNDEEDEHTVRASLVEEVLISMKTQHDFFLRREVPEDYYQSEGVIEFTLALLEWVAKSKDIIAQRYPIGEEVPETRYAAETLEIMRRTVLKPTYIIMEGVAKGDLRAVASYSDEEDFWDKLSERRGRVKQHMKNPDDHEEYIETQEKIAHGNPKHYTEAEWKEILEAELVYLMDYTKGASSRELYKLSYLINFMSRFTNDGVPVYSEERIAPYIAHRNELRNISEAVDGLNNFGELLPWIKQKFGEDATHRTLFEKLGVLPTEELAKEEDK